MRKDYDSNKILRIFTIIYLIISLPLLILIYKISNSYLYLNSLALLLIIPILPTVIFLVKKNKKKQLYLTDLSKRTIEINKEFEERKHLIKYLVCKLNELRDEKEQLIEEINKLKQ